MDDTIGIPHAGQYVVVTRRHCWKVLGRVTWPERATASPAYTSFNYTILRVLEQFDNSGISSGDLSYLDSRNKETFTIISKEEALGTLL